MSVVFLTVSGALLSYTDGASARLPERTRLLASTSRLDPQWVRELDVDDIPRHLIRLGAEGQPPRLLVWGDSHAMAILPAIDSLGMEKGIAARAATHSETVPLLDYYTRSRYGLNERSIPFNAAVLRYIQTDNIRTVLLAGSWASVLGNPGAPEALLRTVDALQASGVTVYLLKPVPVFPFDVAKAVVQASIGQADVSRLVMAESEYEGVSGLPPSLLRELGRRRVHILEPARALQARTHTTVFVPYDAGGSFYRDRAHVSTYGALALRPLFASMVEPLVLPR